MPAGLTGIINFKKTMVNLQALQSFYNRLSKREKTIFYITVTVVFILLFVKLLIEPFANKMRSQREEINNKRKLIELDTRLLAIKDVIAQEAKKYENYFSQAGSAEEEVILIQQEIQSIADRLGVYIGYIRSSETLKEGFFTIYYITVNCEGEMPHLVEFMYELENSSKLLSVEKYSLNLKSEGSSVVQCRMTVSKTVIP